MTKRSERLQRAVAHAMIILGALILMHVSGCAGADDAAPPAPDHVPAEAAAIDDDVDADKHISGTHLNSGTTSAPPGTTLLYDTCNPDPSSWAYAYSCWWRDHEYGLRRVFTNTTWNTWTLDRVTFTFCYDYLGTVPPGAWIVSNTAQGCINNKCVDVSNRVQTSGECRTVTVNYNDLPLVIPPQQSRHVDLYVMVKGWGVPNPQDGVGMSISGLTYWDWD